MWLLRSWARNGARHAQESHAWALLAGLQGWGLWGSQSPAGRAAWGSIKRNAALALGPDPGQEGLRIPSTLQTQPSHLAVLGLWEPPMQ